MAHATYKPAAHEGAKKIKGHWLRKWSDGKVKWEVRNLDGDYIGDFDTRKEALASIKK